MIISVQSATKAIHFRGGSCRPETFPLQAQRSRKTHLRKILVRFMSLQYYSNDFLQGIDPFGNREEREGVEHAFVFEIIVWRPQGGQFFL